VEVKTDKPKERTSFLDQEHLTALQAKEKAQFIAFGPVIFKVALALRNLGLLPLIQDAKGKGITVDELSISSSVNAYALKVLLEGGVQGGILIKRDDRFILSKTGYFIMSDEMTKVNFDFIDDVCYRGFDHLEEAVASGKPAGLKELGNWPTIYRGLSQLPQKVQDSWFAFDHYYSDDVFEKVLPVVFSTEPKKLLDIGGNTGKFALQCVNYNQQAQVTIVDLPGQVGLAQSNIAHKQHADRISFYEADMLDESSKLPTGYNAIWMSQFLDCFSEREIVAILKKCAEAADADTQIFILEPLTDKQQFDASELVVQLTSLYFTVMANGNSRMYASYEMEKLINAAGLKVVELITGLGICQSLIICKKQ
jgi:hypothetical protein